LLHKARPNANPRALPGRAHRSIVRDSVEGERKNAEIRGTPRRDRSRAVVARGRRRGAALSAPHRRRPIWSATKFARRHPDPDLYRAHKVATCAGRLGISRNPRPHGRDGMGSLFGQRAGDAPHHREGREDNVAPATVFRGPYRALSSYSQMRPGPAMIGLITPIPGARQRRWAVRRAGGAASATNPIRWRSPPTSRGPLSHMATSAAAAGRIALPRAQRAGPGRLGHRQRRKPTTSCPAAQGGALCRWAPEGGLRGPAPAMVEILCGL